MPFSFGKPSAKTEISKNFYFMGGHPYLDLTYPWEDAAENLWFPCPDRDIFVLSMFACVKPNSYVKSLKFLEAF